MKTAHGLAMLAAAAALTLSACGGGGGAAGGGGNAARGKDLFTSKQCLTCHAMAAVPASASASIGPKLDGIATAAATRKPAMTAEAYLRESLKDPNAFISPGFTGPPSLMVLPLPVNDAEISDLVAFLMTQK